MSLLPPEGMAQNSFRLPAAGAMLTPTGSFTPPHILGMTIYPAEPLKLKFIIDPGDDNLSDFALQNETKRLVNYFLATLTVPDDEMWVNLSPYEKDRIIAAGLGTTEMGRDMLAQDYLLKQFTASLMYPEEELGEKFWEKVYAKAQSALGSTEIPTNTFNKVWIVPEKAVIYVNGTNIFVSESRLKVFLEEDYLAMEENRGQTNHGVGNVDEADIGQMSEEAKNIIREVMIPVIEKEVNEGKTFANLRQIYYSMILATWYKKNLKESILGKVYMNANKVEGIDLEDKGETQRIYNRYVRAFKNGVYNYIKEDYDPVSQKVIPRKYFAGGWNVTAIAEKSTVEEKISDAIVDRADKYPWSGADVDLRFPGIHEPLVQSRNDDVQEDDLGDSDAALATYFHDKLKSGQTLDFLTPEDFEDIVPGKFEQVMRLLAQRLNWAIEETDGTEGRVFRLSLPMSMGFDNPFRRPESLDIVGDHILQGGGSVAMDVDEQKAIFNRLAEISTLKNVKKLEVFVQSQDQSVNVNSVQGLINAIKLIHKEQNPGVLRNALVRMGYEAASALVASLREDSTNEANGYFISALQAMVGKGVDLSAYYNDLFNYVVSISQRNDALSDEMDNVENIRYNNLEEPFQLLLSIGVQPEATEFVMKIHDQYESAWALVYRALAQIGPRMSQEMAPGVVNRLEDDIRNRYGKAVKELATEARRSILSQTDRRQTMGGTKEERVAHFTQLFERDPFLLGQARLALDARQMQQAGLAIEEYFVEETSLGHEEIMAMDNLNPWISVQMSGLSVAFMSTTGVQLFTANRLDAGLSLIFDEERGLGAELGATFDSVLNGKTTIASAKMLPTRDGGIPIQLGNAEFDLWGENYYSIVAEILNILAVLELDFGDNPHELRNSILMAALTLYQEYVGSPKEGLDAVLKIAQRLRQGESILKDSIGDDVDIDYLRNDPEAIRPLFHGATQRMAIALRDRMATVQDLKAEDIQTVQDLDKVVGPEGVGVMSALVSNLRDQGVLQKEWDNISAQFTWMNGSAVYEQTYTSEVDRWLNNSPARDNSDLKKAVVALYYDEIGRAREFEMTRKISDLVKNELTEDFAVATTSPDPDVGGIDFNPNMLDLSQQGDQIHFQMNDFMFQDIDPAFVYGIQPVITHMSPIYNPLHLLGLSE